MDGIGCWLGASALVISAESMSQRGPCLDSDGRVRTRRSVWFRAATAGKDARNVLTLQNGYRWIYGLKTKDEALNVVKRWYAFIADFRAKRKLVVLMRDNAYKYKSEEIMQFLDSKGVQKHFSTPKEQWQIGSAEASGKRSLLLPLSTAGIVQWFPGGMRGSLPCMEAICTMQTTGFSC